LARAGKTIVVATHDEHEIQCDFDRVVHLANGREVPTAEAAEVVEALAETSGEPA
jgi:energy-coupling factor transporter ATP-binding protein EcfA2